jgi:polar amino acid transport system substrate-binding protein
MFPFTTRRLAAFAVAAAAGLTAAGCGSNPSDSGSADTTASVGAGDPAITALIPAEVRKKGELTIATDGGYPPMDFSKGGSKELIGLEPDIQNQLGKLMGLKFKRVIVGFDSIVPGLQAHRYDASFAGFWITPERTKVVDMVSYFRSGSQYIVRTDDTKGPINSLADMCGRTAALQSGSYEVTWTKQASQVCQQQGKPPVKIQVYKTQDQANLALTSGRADSTGTGAEVAAYNVKLSGGKLKLAGDIFHDTDGGIALPKGSPLTKAFQAAFAKIIADSSYKQIFTKWGLVNSMINSPEVKSA